MSAARATSLIVIEAERTHGRCVLYGRCCSLTRTPKDGGGSAAALLGKGQ